MQPKKKRKASAAGPKKQRARVSALKPRLVVAPPAKESGQNGSRKTKDEKSLLIAQEVKFARLLAHNDKKVRDKVLKNLRKWLTVRSQSSFAFTEDDFLRLWKGLFYCMWMSDKPLVQEELAEALSNLVHCFNNMDTALLYTKCTLKSLATEWFGIDRFRIDKFEMLVRKIIRQTFFMCKKQCWTKEWVIGVAKVMEDILLDAKTCLGLKLHITDVYMEELAKVSEGQIPKAIVTKFVRPYVIYLACTDDKRQIKHVVKNVFRYLIFQSDVGMEYSEKFEAWREAGFPCEKIDEMQKIELPDEDEDPSIEEECDNSGEELKEKPLDPRAGRVNVEIPQLPFNPAQIVTLLKENKFHKSSTTITRKQITQLINYFTKLSQGEMPLGIKEIPVADTTRIDPYEAAGEFINFNDELYSDSSKNYRKRKKNGDISNLDEETPCVEEFTPTKSDNSVIIKSKCKKQKLLQNNISDELDNEDSEKVNNQNNDNEKLNSEIIKKIKQKGKVKQKTKSKRLNVSDPLPKKKLKKSSKKLNNTISGGIEKSIDSNTADADNSKISVKKANIISKYTEESNANSETSIISSKPSTSSNWSVEVATPPKSTPTTPTKTKKNKTPEKNDVSFKTKENKHSLKNNIPWLTPVLTRLEEQNKTPTSQNSVLSPKTDSEKKRVKIMLQRNMAQNTTEYVRQILKNPAIPFDANRKPKAGVLKPSPVPSPINPFYKKKMF